MNPHYITNQQSLQQLTQTPEFCSVPQPTRQLVVPAHIRWGVECLASRKLRKPWEEWVPIADTHLDLVLVPVEQHKRYCNLVRQWSLKPMEVLDEQAAYIIRLRCHPELLKPTCPGVQAGCDLLFGELEEEGPTFGCA
eukprot:TRINITY_DN70336_c0_g1_i1.p1 TRINITY_DN70336_c0_g1~~TRINITY_DN70336_c0_g1_i1.p1  ORF type:complete len:138 (-),score=9.89 TRINITY_DN70336_c0_g1_i1:78-491(-)